MCIIPSGQAFRPTCKGDNTKDQSSKGLQILDCSNCPLLTF